ncbi:predicted protein [Naegleria gruberi]|uniref:Predicted protein n=1 Tax=Naegleria gruberi TaxID=5762 RepID=D2W347_NAEGR|nr:uncharacterized protein NAEGRDRAFT_75819 [Naegleria gruberi]EFC36551.1 predicted protein [Naegleria gruberi]|eukprot:XP_002669295.1 predicted protein [Naegleria gruberi strain NEG-M]
MLFFDDPFLIRVDMILLSFNIIILIIISAISDHHVIYFFRLIMFILFCLVSGGSCVIKYLIDKIQSSKSQQIEGELESYLKHQDFRDLIREYCVKELSLENYNFFTFLLELKLKSKKKLSIELMDEISQVYLNQNSTFELNISSTCRKNFFILRKRIQDQNETELSTESNSFVQTIQDLILVFEGEILANLRDTFSRMENTNEFKTWLYAFKVQQQNNIF